jgi:two-component system sensor histidine kinase KdpD
MQQKSRIFERFFPPGWPQAYMVAAGVVLAGVVLAFLLHRLMPHASLSLLFLTGVIIVAVRTGPGPSLFAGLLSFLAYNYLFTPPYYTFGVADDGDVATLVFFLLMAVITGNLAARMREEVARRRSSLQRISNLYEFGRHMSSAAGATGVLDALVDHLAHSLGRPAAVLVADAGGITTVGARAGSTVAVPAAVIETAGVQDEGEPAMVEGWYVLDLTTRREPASRLAIRGPLDAEQLDLARSLRDQAAVALDRTRLVADLEQVRLVSETEQLRSALLSSISHDLRTPLASIIGSTTSLLEYGTAFSEENRRELLATVVEEAQRLDRHIQNLLDMTRLGHGSLTLSREWVDLHDIVGSAVGRLRDVLKGMPVDVMIADSVPLLWVHGVLIEQALVNLLDNAVRFSPPDGRLSITATASEARVEIELCDDGPGIPEDEREKIFDMFYTVRQGDRSHLQGTGLGLAICRGMVAAHGGSVTAHDGRHGRGTCMRIVLPEVRPDGREEA